MLQKCQIIPDSYQEKTLEIELSIIGYVHGEPCRVWVSKTLFSAFNVNLHLFKGVCLFFFTMGEQKIIWFDIMLKFQSNAKLPCSFKALG